MAIQALIHHPTCTVRQASDKPQSSDTIWQNMVLQPSYTIRQASNKPPYVTICTIWHHMYHLHHQAWPYNHRTLSETVKQASDHQPQSPPSDTVLHHIHHLTIDACIGHYCFKTDKHKAMRSRLFRCRFTSIPKPSLRWTPFWDCTCI